MNDEAPVLPSAPPFRIPSISVWGILVFLVRDFGLYLVVAAVLGALAGGAVFGLSGFLLGSQLTEGLVDGSNVTLNVLGYVLFTLITIGLTVAGLAHGFLFTVITFVLRKTDTVEKELHEFLEPISRALVARIPFGQEGIPVDAFVDVFDPVLHKLYVEGRPKRFSIFFFGNALLRFAFRLVVRAVRWAVDELFVEELKEDGVTHVNMTQMERFTREKLADLVLDRYTFQLKAVRTLVVVVGSVVIVSALVVSGVIASG